MRLGVVVLALLGGCNQVFGLDPTQLRDAGAGDLDSPPAGCTPYDLDVDIAAYIFDDGTYGKDTVLFTDADHHALLAFPMDGVGKPGEHVAGAVLKVAPITMCGTPPCSACVQGGSPPATQYKIYWTWDNWNESNVTETERDTGNPWDAPGADLPGAIPGNNMGEGDRSPLVVEAPLPAPSGSALELHIPRPAIEANRAEPWIATHSSGTPMTRLTIQLRTDQLAAFASDDHDESLCGEPAPAPKLTVTTCP